MRIPVFLFMLLPLASLAASEGGGMSQSQLENTIRSLSSMHEGSDGLLRFVYKNVPMVAVSDIANDRMRIVAPIVALEELEPQQLFYMLAANYHTALDARYAISEGVVYGVFIHPLAALTDEEITAALRQVAGVVLTFGNEYTSGELVFGAQ